MEATSMGQNLPQRPYFSVHFVHLELKLQTFSGVERPAQTLCQNYAD